MAAATTVATDTALVTLPIVQSVDKVDVSWKLQEEEVVKSEEILTALKPFDGTGDVDMFLFKFEHVAQTYHWTEEEQYLYLLQKLRGAADSVLEGCSKEQQNYTEVTRRLRQRFSNAKSPEQARMELQSRRQLESETLQELAGDIQNLTVLCAPQISYEERERYDFVMTAHRIVYELVIISQCNNSL
jgi:hypothetical protein